MVQAAGSRATPYRRDYHDVAKSRAPTRIGLATEQGSAAPGGGSNRTRPSTSSGKNRGSWRVTHVAGLPRG